MSSDTGVTPSSVYQATRRPRQRRRIQNLGFVLRGFELRRLRQYLEKQREILNSPRHRPYGCAQRNHAGAAGVCPSIATRPAVGFNPAMPQKCAGTRIDPERSLPRPAGERYAAIAAASPPLDPPRCR